MRNLIYKIPILIFQLVSMYIVILAFILQYIVPLNAALIIFDLLILIDIALSGFRPRSWDKYPLFSGGRYNLISKSILIVVALIILYQHYDIALDATLGFLGLNR
ncbi:MAG: hypothetical protein LBL47_00020 [Lactobacillus sp.]|jgi:hypothetical protein|nr:hypothetical protein [Lactobacillus sp.]